ncbi:hypothetical protein H8356DRAFT_1347340 [Neocallimastix lanati (nom. inval.)]|nr:hypothetical protein H8356DRAFT_1347340 [Neocallimastix sp. JGI-2020a]
MNNSQLKLNKKGWVITLDISMGVLLNIWSLYQYMEYTQSFIKTLCCSSINISSRIKTYCICMTFNNNHRNIYKHRCKMTLYDLHISVDIFALFIDKITAVLTIKGIQNHHIATFNVVQNLASLQSLQTLSFIYNHSILTNINIKNHIIYINSCLFQIVNKHIGFYGLFMPNYAI